MKFAVIVLFVLMTAAFLFSLPYVLYFGFGWGGYLGILAGGAFLVAAYAALLTQIWRRALPVQS